MTETVLITGGAGFVGSHLVDRIWHLACPASPLAVGGSAVLLLVVWMVVRLAMPILIERMSA